MAKTSRNLRVDRDGVRVHQTSAPKRFDIRIVAGVLAMVALGAGVFFLRPSPAPSRSTGRVAERQPEPGAAQAEAVQVPRPEVPMPPKQEIRAVHVDRERAPVDPSAERKTQERNKDQPDVDARDVILALQASGEKEGIAAFNPPGTNPPKSGIIVPEDFELPEGYVRHYQATDDGQRLDAILMFSPDYEFVDPSGHPISLPEDLIVPPELAPPGLPIRMLEIPKRGLR